MRIPYLAALAIGLYILGSSLVLAGALLELQRINDALAGCGLK